MPPDASHMEAIKVSWQLETIGNNAIIYPSAGFEKDVIAHFLQLKVVDRLVGECFE